jgi:hypothetical protein
MDEILKKNLNSDSHLFIKLNGRIFALPGKNVLEISEFPKLQKCWKLRII